MEHASGARIIIDDKSVGKEVASISASTAAVLADAVAKVKQAVTDARAAPTRPVPGFVQQIAVSTRVRGASSKDGSVPGARGVLRFGCGSPPHRARATA